MNANQGAPRARLALHGLLCFAATFLTYALTASSGVGMEDDGLFVLTAYSNGVAHPPGYPLYTLLGWVASQVPVSTVAYRVHMLSALAGALACVLVWRISLHYTGRLSAAWLAGIGYGLSATFWSQAIVAEVYTLNSLLFFSLFYLLLQSADRGPPTLTGRTALAGGLLAGLGLSLHWPLFLLASPGLLPLLWRLRKLLPARSPVIFTGLLIGLAPFAWMVYRSQAPGVPAFYGPISNWDELVFYVLRKGYSDVDISPTAGLRDQLQFAGFALRSTASEFSLVAAPFLLLGIMKLIRSGNHARSIATLLGFSGTALLLPFLLHFDFDVFHQALFRVYPLTAYGFAAIWLGAGATLAADQLNARLNAHLTVLRPNWLIPGALLGAILISNLPANSRANDHWAGQYARTLLDVLPEGALLWLDSDLTSGPIGYLNLVEGVRPDVTLFNSNGLLFPTRLFRRYRQTTEEETAIVADFIASTQRPVVYIDFLQHPYGVRNHGLFQVIDKELQATESHVVMDRTILAFLDTALTMPPPDEAWKALHRGKLVSQYGTLLAQLVSSTRDQHTDATVLNRLEQVTGDLYGALAVAEVMVAAATPDWERADAALSRARGLLGKAFFKRTAADVYYLSGIVAESRGDRHASSDWFCRSWRAWPAEENRSRNRVDSECHV